MTKSTPASYFVFLICSMLLCFAPANLYAKAGGFISQPPTLNDQEEDVDPKDLLHGIRRAIVQEPENYKHYGALAFACDHQGDYKCELEALKSGEKYLPADYPERDIFYSNLARAYMLNDLWEDGKQWVDKADNINPDNIYNRWNSFDYYLHFKKDSKSAASELKKIDALYEKGWDAYHDACRKALDMLPRQDVIRLFKEAVKADPHNAKSHRALGIALRGSTKEDFAKNMPAAMKELKKALALDPEYILTYITIADTYFLTSLSSGKKELYQDALAWFDKAAAIDPQNVKLAYAMGHMFIYMKEHDQAIAKLEYALAQDPDSDDTKEMLARAYNNKAYAFYQAGENLEQGIEIIDKAIALAPEDGMYLSTKAELLFKMKNYPEAHQFIKRAIALKPDVEEMKKDLAMIEEKLKQKEKSD